MLPVQVEHRGSNRLVIIHRCLSCGFTRPNRVADDPVQGDDIEAVISVITARITGRITARLTLPACCASLQAAPRCQTDQDGPAIR